MALLFLPDLSPVFVNKEALGLKHRLPGCAADSAVRVINIVKVEVMVSEPTGSFE